jgi:hypothetical protein
MELYKEMEKILDRAVWVSEMAKLEAVGELMDRVKEKMEEVVDKVKPVKCNCVSGGFVAVGENEFKCGSCESTKRYTLVSNGPDDAGDWEEVGA